MGKVKSKEHMKIIRQYAGSHAKLITLGRFIAAISAVLSLLPFYYLWKIIGVAVEGDDLDRIKKTCRYCGYIDGIIAFGIYRCSFMYTYRGISNSGKYAKQPYAKNHHASARSF